MYHLPVLCNEIHAFAQKYLANKREVLIVDGTLGDGGHTLSLLDALPQAKLLAFDCDREMLQRSMQRFHAQGLPYLAACEFSGSLKTLLTQARILVFHESFHKIAHYLHAMEQGADLILLDLGLAMYHFKEAKRGFSYQDEQLDMRLDHSRMQFEARHILLRASWQELRDMFLAFGEEKYASLISRAIVKARQQRPLESARELAELVRSVIAKKQHRNRKTTKSKRHKGNPASHTKIHAATRVFQALRIAVNQELSILRESLANLPPCLEQGGLFLVIAFHSLEDRLVKQSFRSVAMPAHRKGSEKANYVIVSPKAIVPKEEEIRANKASRSARLRIMYCQKAKKNMYQIQR